jgi:hypothetical protein
MLKRMLWLMSCWVMLMVAMAESAGPGPAGGTDYVWWEAENPVATNFPKGSAFSPSTFPDTRHLLSGGDWLSNSGTRAGDEAYAKYRVEVPAAGDYELWARKFWRHGPFRWRFGEEEWRVCGREIALADDTYLRTHLGANWVFLGKVGLPEGAQTFELRLLAGEGEELTAAFDCFALTAGPFVPNGKLKPGERWGLADEGYFPFEPQADRFSSEALLDLRSLNEKVAGESGFVGRRNRGFVLGNGRPVRFWAVNVGPGNIAQHRGSVDYLARALAKRGVNMVRIHGPLFDASQANLRIAPRSLDNLFYAVAAFKREGIYTTISCYFPLWLDIRPAYGIPGYETIANKKPFALLYFDEKFQGIYRGWLRTLLTTVNPYTGVTLAREPALAMVEIVNEDSFFFWTFTKENVPAVHWQRLEAMYGGWLGKRYGSIENALATWGDRPVEGDDPAAGRAGLYQAWHMTGEGIRAGGPSKAKRVGDQVRFLTEVQRSFYADTVRYLKGELRLGGLVSASNWQVSDPALLDALERYTYSAAEVIDGHGYFGGRHEGEGASYSVRVGHSFQDLAGVTVPWRLPMQFVQVEGYPQIISEIGWTNPNRYRAEAAFLASGYGALQGIDGIYFFAVGSNYLRDGGMAKFAVSCPVIAGAFPAAALQYRRGDVREGQDAIHQLVDLEDLYQMKGSGLWGAAALDELRKQEVPEGGEEVGAGAGLEALAFWVGPVVREFKQRAGRARQLDLAAYINRETRTVDSVTGELHWDYGSGLATVNTPRSQGAAGFLGKAGRIRLRDVTIECDNEFASVMVISLDDRPLATSRRILIQAVTEEQPYGFRTEGNRITDMGGAPFGVKRIRARVSLPLKGARAPRVVALDENGYATGRMVATSPRPEGELQVTLAEDAIYHVIVGR